MTIHTHSLTLIAFTVLHRRLTELYVFITNIFISNIRKKLTRNHFAIVRSMNFSVTGEHKIPNRSSEHFLHTRSNWRTFLVLPSSSPTPDTTTNLSMLCWSIFTWSMTWHSRPAFRAFTSSRSLPSQLLKSSKSATFAQCERQAENHLYTPLQPETAPFPASTHFGGLSDPLQATSSPHESRIFYNTWPSRIVFLPMLSVVCVLCLLSFFQKLDRAQTSREILLRI